MKPEHDPQHYRFSYPLPMRWSDIDEFHHVNNAKFLTYFEEGRFRYLREACSWNWKKHGLILAHVSIDYLRPLLFTDKPVIYVKLNKMGGKSFELGFVILNEKGGKQVPVSAGHCVMVGFDYGSDETVAIPEPFRSRLQEYDATSLKTDAQ